MNISSNAKAETQIEVAMKFGLSYSLCKKLADRFLGMWPGQIRNLSSKTPQALGRIAAVQLLADRFLTVSLHPQAI